MQSGKYTNSQASGSTTESASSPIAALERARLEKLRPTPGQLRVLRAICNYHLLHEYAPSIRELGDILGLRSLNGVHEHLLALERRGLIRRAPIKSRSVVVTPYGKLFATGVL